jgi:flagellar basal body-associated protein FliL
MASAVRTIGMVLTDPLQWVIIIVIIVALLAVAAYILLRLIQTLAKADRYFTKEKETNRRPTRR